jgi:hypothetical protein
MCHNVEHTRGLAEVASWGDTIVLVELHGSTLLDFPEVVYFQTSKL